MTCPECGSEKGFHIVHGQMHMMFIECRAKDCHFTSRPDDDLLIEAALKTYQREQEKAGTK